MALPHWSVCIGDLCSFFYVMLEVKGFVQPCTVRLIFLVISACEEATVLQGVHLSKTDLSEPAVEALENIACATNVS